jgi:hypothetical protein
MTELGKLYGSMSDTEEKPLKTVEIPTTTESKPPTKKRGRPRKAAVEAKKRGNRGVRGRPPGDAARINEFKARLLATSGDKVINKIIQIALDDEHQGQMAALKMCMDRVLPVSYFEKDKTTGGRNSVSITITGIGGETQIVGEDSTEDDIVDAEYTEVTNEE